MSEDTSADGVIAGTAECTHPRLAKIIGTIPRHLYVAKKTPSTLPLIQNITGSHQIKMCSTPIFKNSNIIRFRFKRFKIIMIFGGLNHLPPAYQDDMHQSYLHVDLAATKLRSR